MALPRFGMPRFVITLAGTEGAKFRKVSRIEVAQCLTSQARLNATLLIPGSFGEQCGKIWTPGSGWARRCQNLCVVDPSPPAGTEGAKFQKVSCFEDVHVLTLLTPQCRARGYSFRVASEYEWPDCDTRLRPDRPESANTLALSWFGMALFVVPGLGRDRRCQIL